MNSLGRFWMHVVCERNMWGKSWLEAIIGSSASFKIASFFLWLSCFFFPFYFQQLPLPPLSPLLFYQVVSPCTLASFCVPSIHPCLLLVWICFTKSLFFKRQERGKRFAIVSSLRLPLSFLSKSTLLHQQPILQRGLRRCVYVCVVVRKRTRTGKRRRRRRRKRHPLACFLLFPSPRLLFYHRFPIADWPTPCTTFIQPRQSHPCSIDSHDNDIFYSQDFCFPQVQVYQAPCHPITCRLTVAHFSSSFSAA